MSSAGNAAVTRRLAAILIADVVGYTRLMERDDTGTFSRLRAIRDEVVDPATGHTIARFVPRGQDWEITDPSDVLIARVLRDSKHGIVKFRAMIGEAEAVRFKWAQAGLSVYSAELEIEFLTSPNEQPRSLDPVLAIAIAPILEQRVRIEHVRANS